MAIKYQYKIDNQIIETLNLSDIPENIEFKTITFEKEEELEEDLELKKKLAYEELKETDWYIIRFQETGKEIPQEILNLREQIRNRY